MLRYGSVCSGIESASVAWEPLGMSAAWFSEIEPFPCSVLKHHWPDVANFGDMTILPALMRMGLMEAPDVLVGGTPCQAFSVAGKRESLDDNRGQLTLTYVDLLNAIDEQRVGDECVAVWENVPGVLNTKDNAFGCFLGELSGSGCELQPSGKRWGNVGCVFGPQRTVAWRIIDAQYFGVAQRRRRVFVVASARNGFDPTKILFESEGVRRDIAPSRETRKEVTGSTPNCSHWGNPRNVHPTLNQSHSTGGIGTRDPALTLLGKSNDSTAYDLNTYVVHGTQDPCVSNELSFALGINNGAENAVQSLTIRGRGCELGSVELSNTIRASTGGGDKPYVLAHGTQDPCVSNELSFALGRNNGAENAVQSLTIRGRGCVTPLNTQVITRHNAMGRGTGFGLGDEGAAAYTLSTAHHHAVHYGSHVRRLTPTECERLQGFPDGHTDVPHRGKSAADGPRYKAIGNSKAVPCIQWIGARLLMYQMGHL